MEAKNEKLEKLTKKQVISNTKKEIKKLLKVIEEQANNKVLRALNSGCIAENSEFLQENCLLALTVLEDEFKGYKVKSNDYRKEADNIQLFL